MRQEYESSLSWRLTRPLRGVGRLRRGRSAAADTAGVPAPAAHPWLAPDRLDGWLEQCHGLQLAELDAACRDRRDPGRFALFRDVDLDLWALLLTQQYDVYPNIRSLLPDVPEPALQELWNGTSGVPLAAQSMSFYRKLCARYLQHGAQPLAQTRVLDYGCGWGRLTRFLARDVTPGNLYGCDPVAGIVDFCRRSRVPATVEQSDFLPRSLPLDHPVDLAFAFSVFTHLSDESHEYALSALHGALRPGGILVVTIRPPSYLTACALMWPLLVELGPDPQAALAGPRFLHVAHATRGTHPQHGGGKMHYGETVITMQYVRERWAELFDLLSVDLLVDDIHQVMVTLRRR